jgi:putative ABC transport system permease protein
MKARLTSAVYRFFLRIVPAEFRSSDGDEMEEAFLESLAIRETNGGGLGTLGALAHAFWDVLALAHRLHRNRSRAARDSRRRGAFTGLWSDFRIASRRLIRTPALTLASVVTLALGIAATVLMLTIVDSVLIRPLPYAEADRLVALFLNEETRGAPRAPTSPVNFLAWQSESRSLNDMTAAHPWAPSLTGWDRPDELHGLKVTPSLFQLLRVPPLLGRSLEPGDVPSAVVLGYDLWRRRFGSDRQIVGRALTLDGEAHVVVGVMPEGFHFPPFWSTDAEMWSPLVFTPEQAAYHSRFLRVFARLADEVPFEEARAELETIGARLVERYPDRNRATSVTIEPLLEPVVSGARPVLLLLLAAVVLLTAIAFANIVNLQLVRATSRARALALEVALGAGRGRLLREQLAESLLFSLASGLAGGLAAAWGVSVLKGVAPEGLPRLQEIGLDEKTFFLTLAVSVLVALGLGLVTARHLFERDAAGALRATSVRGTSVAGKRAQSALVVAQVAISVVLLVGAALVSRSFRELGRVDPGFRESGMFTASLLLAGSSHATPAGQLALFDQVREAVSVIPGVDDVAVINHLPIGGDSWGMSFRLEGEETDQEAERPRASHRTVTPGYFRTMGVTLLAGRDFGPGDDERGAMVVLVNRTLAERYATIETIVGRRIEAQGDVRTVVGVVSDTKQWDLMEAVDPEVYFPYAQNPSSSFLTATLVVASASPLEELKPLVERAVWSIADEIPVTNVRSIERILSDHVAPRRFTSFVFSAFAGLALLLSAVGLYGVLSFTVSQQRAELGVRAALGASRGRIGRLVFGRGARLVGLGIAVGLVVSLAGGRFLSGLLFGIRPTDPLTFVLVPLFLTVVASVAIGVPARRAARLDPVLALRSE